MKTPKAKNGITIPSIINDKESSEMLTIMDENPVAVMNHIKDLIQNLKLKDIEIKELEKEKQDLIKTFEELLDYSNMSGLKNQILYNIFEVLWQKD